MLATNRDPTLQEYGTAGKSANNNGCYAIIHSGGQMVRSDDANCACSKPQWLSAMRPCTLYFGVLLPHFHAPALLQPAVVQCRVQRTVRAAPVADGLCVAHPGHPFGLHGCHRGSAA
jgi:hypothetical protein